MGVQMSLHSGCQWDPKAAHLVLPSLQKCGKQWAWVSGVRSWCQTAASMPIRLGAAFGAPRRLRLKLQSGHRFLYVAAYTPQKAAFEAGNAPVGGIASHISPLPTSHALPRYAAVRCRPAAVTLFLRSARSTTSGISLCSPSSSACRRAPPPPRCITPCCPPPCGMRKRHRLRAPDHSTHDGHGAWGRGVLATSVQHLRRDQEELGPPEPCAEHVCWTCAGCVLDVDKGAITE